MNTLSTQQRHAWQNAVLEERLTTLMPRLMRETGIDLWLILAGEYNEDPVFKTLVPARCQYASRLTCLAFSLGSDGSFEAVSINKPNPALAAFYRPIPYNSDTQWQAISDYIAARNPQRIGVNISGDDSLCGGLSHGLYARLTGQLGPELAARLVSAEPLCVRWMEQRLEAELSAYPALYALTTHVLARAFSRECITPGLTTTQELEYWVTDQFARLGVGTCFPTDINLQRQGEGGGMLQGVIRPGDLLHYDAGVDYLGLCTDHQRLAYVLRPGESQAPEGIAQGFAQGRRFGDMVAREFIAGRTGNDIFLAAKQAAQSAGMEASLYTHPIGNYCHAAGPTVGMYDKQAPIPHKGDRVLHPDTAYALEYNVAATVPQWGGQKVWFYLEETVLFRRDSQLEYLDTAYRDLLLI